MSFFYSASRLHPGKVVHLVKTLKTIGSSLSPAYCPYCQTSSEFSSRGPGIYGLSSLQPSLSVLCFLYHLLQSHGTQSSCSWCFIGDRYISYILFSWCHIFIVISPYWLLDWNWDLWNMWHNIKNLNIKKKPSYVLFIYLCTYLLIIYRKFWLRRFFEASMVLRVKTKTWGQLFLHGSPNGIF